MKFRSWLSTCSSAVCISTAEYDRTPPPKAVSLFCDTSSGSNTQGSSSSTTSQDTSYSSLQSNLSLQTLPSVPSLQKLISSGSLNLSVTHQCLAALKPSPAQVGFLAIHNKFLYAASGNEVNVFDISSLTLKDTFNAKDSSSGSVKFVTFCNGRVFTAHQDTVIRVWQLTPTKKHRLIAILPTMKDRLRNFVFSKNYVNVRRHKKRLWIEHHDTVSGLAVANDYSLICSVSWDKYLKIWRVSDSRCLQSVKAHDDAINAVAVSADGTIYTASADRRIRVWGRPFGERKHSLIATLEKHKSAVNALALSTDGTVLFSGARDRSILVWEREDSANHMVVAGALRGHSKAILCLINVSDLLFSGSADRTVRIWQRGHKGRYCCLSVVDGHEKPVKALAAVRDESGGVLKVFSGSLDGEIKAWQVMVFESQRP